MTAVYCTVCIQAGTKQETWSIFNKKILILKLACCVAVPFGKESCIHTFSTDHSFLLSFHIIAIIGKDSPAKQREERLRERKERYCNLAIIVIKKCGILYYFFYMNMQQHRQTVWKWIKSNTTYPEPWCILVPGSWDDSLESERQFLLFRKQLCLRLF